MVFFVCLFKLFYIMYFTICCLSIEEMYFFMEIWGGNIVFLKGLKIFCLDYIFFFRVVKSYNVFEIIYFSVGEIVDGNLINLVSYKRKEILV